MADLFASVKLTSMLHGDIPTTMRKTQSITVHVSKEALQALDKIIESDRWVGNFKPKRHGFIKNAAETEIYAMAKEFGIKVGEDCK